VTVMTTAFNVETVPGRRAGLPYMETIALRGLIPLHVPHKVLYCTVLLNPTPLVTATATSHATDTFKKPPLTSPVREEGASQC